MNRSNSLKTSAILAAGIFLLLHASQADPPPPESPEGESRVSLEVARDRAQVMHRVYAATLEVMHDRYFHEERSILPARALEDVFAEIARQSKINARWIAVNTKAMSVNHEPKSEFEKEAARALSAGKEEFERVEEGVYYRAAAIPLAAGCVSCHTGHFREAPKSPRFAGLVISIPVKEKE